MTYGPTGIEYAAQACTVVDHDEIQCLTTQGVGRNLHWLVTVEGQTSALSADTTSYAFPEIVSAHPLTGNTDGGTIITINGNNLATFDQPTTYFNGTVMSTTYTIGVDTLFATVPEGYGVNKEIYIAVGGATTNSIYFSYNPPHISNVQTKHVEGTIGN